MIQRFFLDGIDGTGNDLAVSRRIEDSATVAADSAETGFPLRDNALMRAKMTLDTVIFQLFIKQSFLHNAPRTFDIQITAVNEKKKVKMIYFIDLPC